MVLSCHGRACWRLMVLALLIGMVAVAGLGSSPASAAGAAPAHGRSPSRVLVGCAPCISQVTPADGSMATIDPDGKVTISFSAQLNANFAQFIFTLDGTQVDSTKIQVTDTNSDPTQPTGTYRTALSAGQHKAFVQVYDTNGPAASFPWTFTVPQAPTPTPTATRASGGGSTGGSSGGSSSSTGSGGFFTATTISIILFSIAGLGLLVISFIAGMWYGGRRWLSKHP